MIDMREQPFGVEIEMTGITRQQAAEVLTRLWETYERYSGGAYDTWSVLDPQGMISLNITPAAAGTT